MNKTKTYLSDSQIMAGILTTPLNLEIVEKNCIVCDGAVRVINDPMNPNRRKYICAKCGVE